MKRLTKEQKKIIYLGFIVMTFLLCFWILIYAPQSRKLASIKRELMFTEAQIKEINRITEGSELSEAVENFNVRLIKIVSLLTSKEEDVISSLSQEARKLRIEINNITPSQKQLSESEVSGYDIEELPVSIDLVCEFRELGKYLDILKNNFPILIRVRQLDIKGKGEGQPNLDISLKISAYLCKESPIKKQFSNGAK